MIKLHLQTWIPQSRKYHESGNEQLVIPCHVVNLSSQINTWPWSNWQDWCWRSRAPVWRWWGSAWPKPRGARTLGRRSNLAPIQSPHPWCQNYRQVRLHSGVSESANQPASLAVSGCLLHSAQQTTIWYLENRPKQNMHYSITCRKSPDFFSAQYTQ